MATLDFSTLIPTPDSFKDADGQTYPFLSPLSMSSMQFAAANEVQKQAQAAMQALSATPDQATIEAVEAVSLKMLALILPDLPAARAQSFSLAQRMAIINYWAQSDDTKKAQGQNRMSTK